jgi:hypothetical protein
MSITQPVCAFVSLGIHQVLSMRHIIICGLPLSTTFFHIISQKARFKKKNTEHKMRV